MEGQLGLSDLSVVAWVSAVEGCGSHCMQTVLHRSLPNDSAQVVTTRAQPISVDSVPLQW